jgi:hypothetical protein
MYCSRFTGALLSVVTVLSISTPSSARPPRGMKAALPAGARGSTSAQEPDREVERARAFLTGKVQVYYRVGGILYGTHHLADIEYGPAGRYGLAMDTAKATVLDNVQRGGWRDAGRWDVVRVGQQVGVRHQSDGGAVAFFPVQVLDGGEVRLLADGLPPGTERCWVVQGWKQRIGVALGKPPSITLDPR